MSQLILCRAHFEGVRVEGTRGRSDWGLPVILDTLAHCDYCGAPAVHAFMHDPDADEDHGALGLSGAASR